MNTQIRQTRIGSSTTLKLPKGSELLAFVPFANANHPGGHCHYRCPNLPLPLEDDQIEAHEFQSWPLEHIITEQREMEFVGQQRLNNGEFWYFFKIKSV